MLTPKPHIIVNLSNQTLALHLAGRQLRFVVSTALNGAGQQNGSGATPLGKHIVRAKIGAAMPEGAVFVGRRWTGEVLSRALKARFPERDWITSRILWLSGLEPGFNRLGSVDTMRRYIYIHGTADEADLGRPVSHGCIRMSNADIIQLFDVVPVGTTVSIQP